MADDPTFTRSDVGGWLSGPRASLEDQGYEFGYRGQDLGLPQTGRGSLAGLGRRSGALVIDWFASVLIARLIAGGDPSALLPLVVFFVQVAVLTSLMGSSFGQRILGLRVVSLRTNVLDPARTALRTALLCLVIPAVVWDRNQRGLHERAANSAVVRT